MNIDLIAGARPNFMKIAPLHRTLVARGVKPRIVHTGQHYDQQMSDVFFRQLDLPEPDVDLGVGSGSHAAQTAAVMVGYEEIVLHRRPDLVVVVGDVNSTVACSLVAAKLHIPVAHVEAGLRSGDRRMPEEINRIVTDALADLLFVTEASGAAHLKAEGVAPSRIHFVGNVMIDTLVHLRTRARESSTVEMLEIDPGGFALATFHRPSNVDEREAAERVAATLLAVAERVPVVFPAHPRTRQRFEGFGLWEVLRGTGNVRVLEPLGYLEFLALMEEAALVITDSGGIQEETTFLGVPCLTARENTERPVTITHGTNELIELDPAAVGRRVSELMNGAPRNGAKPPLWDGHAASRIADVLLD